MKTAINLALLGLTGYLGYKVYIEKTPLPPEQPLTASTVPLPSSEVLHGTLSSPGLVTDTGVSVFAPPNALDSAYASPEIPFLDLDDNTKTLLLQCYACDYTSPRMINDDRLYNKAVDCANRTGAPCGWVQFILEKRPEIDIDDAAVYMMHFCDVAMAELEFINLPELRSAAINSALNTI